jgi:hypothetical protein
MSELYSIDQSPCTYRSKNAIDALREGEKVSLYNGERTSQFVVKLGQNGDDKEFYQKLAKEQPHFFGSCGWRPDHVGINSVFVSIYWD